MTFDYDYIDEEITKLIDQAEVCAKSVLKNLNCRNPGRSLEDAQALLLCVTQASILRGMLNRVED